MKKGILVGALLLSGGMVGAQGLYVGVGAGYGIGMPADALGSKVVVNSSGQTTESVIYGSYGGGVNANLNVGYMFSEHFGADLGFTYFSGSSVTSTDVSVPTGTATLEGKSTQLRIAPSLVLSTGTSEVVSAYSRLGLVLPAGGSTISEYRDNTNPSSVVERDIETTGALSLGFQGAIGVNYSLSESLSIFGEISGVNLRIKRATSSVTKSTVNGTDVLGMMTTYEKETTYVDELNSSSNNGAYNPNYSTGSAKESLATTTNFNGVFFNIGVKYSL